MSQRRITQRLFLKHVTRTALLAVLTVATFPLPGGAQEAKPVEMPGRRIFVPVEDLDVVLNRDQRGVLLPRGEFAELYAAAKKHDDETARPPHGIVLSQATYRVRTAGDRLLITATLQFSQLEAGWHAVPLRFGDLSVEQAKLGDMPAPLGRHPASPETVLLLNDQIGRHTLSLELSTPLRSSGSDQLATFGVPAVPSALLEMELPAARYLELNGVSLDRPAAEDQAATYRAAIGGKNILRLRITGKAAQQGDDALVFGKTAIGLRVAPEELTWQAVTDVSVHGKPIDRLTFSVPDSLDIVSVESNGLEGWGFEPNPAEKRTVLTLSYRQSFRDTRRIVFRGVTSTNPGEAWTVPNLTLSHATAHTSRVVVQHAPTLRLRADQLDGVRRITDADEVAVEIRRIAASTTDKQEHWQSLYFAAWQEDFTLAFVTQPKAGELQAAIATQLDIQAQGLVLRSSISVESRFAPLFGLDLTLPENWDIARIDIAGEQSPWRVDPVVDGIRRVHIPFAAPLPADKVRWISLYAEWQPENWPLEDQPLQFAIPEVGLPDVDVLEGTYAIRTASDLQVVPVNLTGLDPSYETATAETGRGDQLSYDYQDTRFAGDLRVERKTSRVSATTLTFARLDPETFHAHLEGVINIDGGGLRTIRVSLPEATGEDLRFRSLDRRLQIAEQQPAADIAEGRRIWTLRFDQRYRGLVRLGVDLEMPRGDAAAFAVPDLRVLGAERQNGYTAIEGSGEQQLTITAVNAADETLAEIAPEELPMPLAYRPRERIVAAYHHVQSGERILLSETRFDRLPVPTAICDELRIASVLGETGHLQHQAKFHFRAVGVQSLHINLPDEAALWSTLIDNQPVEVRRLGDAYRVPLPAAGTDEVSHIVVLSYTTHVGRLREHGRLSQEPPRLSVVGGAGDVQPLEILTQSWKIHHPPDTRFLAAHDLYQPDVEPFAPSLLGNLQQGVSIGSWPELLGKSTMLAIVLAVIGLTAVGYRKLGAWGAASVATTCVVILVGVSIAVPTMQFASKAARDGERELVTMGTIVPAGAAPAAAELSGGTTITLDASSQKTPDYALPDVADNSNVEGEEISSGAIEYPELKDWVELSDRRKKVKVRGRQAGDKLPRVATGNIGGGGGIGGGVAGTSGLNQGGGTAGGGVAPWGEESQNGQAGEGSQHPTGAWGSRRPPETPSAETGRLSIGAGVNSDSGVVGDNLGRRRDSLNLPREEADPLIVEYEPTVGRFSAVRGVFGEESLAQLKRGMIADDQNANGAADPFGDAPPPTQLGGLLSLNVQLAPPADSRATSFQYVGAADATLGPKLEVDYLTSRPIPFLTLAWFAGTVVVFWFLRAKLLAARAAVAVVGLSIPLAIAALAPPPWMPALDGVFLGTLAGIALWIAIPIFRRCFDGEASLGGRLKTSILSRTTALLLATLIATLLTADARAGQESKASESTPTKPAPAVRTTPVVETPPAKPAIVIPYDAAGDPLAAERIFLPYEKFVELWNAAYPEKRILGPAPVEAIIAEAMYAAEIDAAGGEHAAIINVTGRVVAYSYHDRQTPLPLPLGNVALDAVDVDERAGALRPRTTDGQTVQEVLLDKPGLHVIDLKFRIPFERTGPAGRFTLPLKPVAAGALRFQLPGEDLKLRVNGSSGAYRRQQLGDDDLAVIPIDRGGDVQVSWQPQQTRAGVDGVIHTETATALSVDDAGVNITSTFIYRVRQGSLNAALFALPAEVTVRKISGPDVAGWGIEGAGDNRQLRVFLQRKVEDATELTFDLFVAQQFTAESKILKLPAFAPLEITRETGRVAVYAGDQFAVTSGVISGVAQIETRDLILPVKYEHVDPHKQQPVAAYRYTTRPFQLELLVRRQQPGLTGNAEHAVLIGSRKTRIRSRWDLKLAGAPKSMITIELPPDFVLLDTISPHLADWSTTTDDGTTLLHVELASPMTGEVPLEVSGFIPRQPADLQVGLQLPAASGADSMRSAVAVWLDAIYSGAMSDIGGWRSVDPGRLSSTLRDRINQPVQFAFMTSSSDQSAIGLSLVQRRPRLAAASLTTIIAKDTAVEYSIACKWKITQAAADTFVFTTPDWLSGKMDFAGTGYRQISEAPAGEGRIRWTVEVDEPRRDLFFVVANVTLPPPTDGKIVAPTIRFEGTADDGADTAPQLETQTQYLILVNHSRDQMDLVTADAVEATSKEEVRIINLPQSLLEQAVDILRVVQPDVAVTWNVRKLQRVKSLPASVNLADNKLVIARDGSWRAQASYRINNRNRQFLALEMPDEARILSVYVADRPSRPVQTTKGGRQLTLIALPKTLAGDFSFTADIVYAGRLPQPQGFRGGNVGFDLPHADVVTPKEDDEFGIPVSKTNWTVYLPEEVEASVIDDPARSNLKLVPTTEHRYDQGLAVMKEAEDVLSSVLETANSSRRGLSSSELKEKRQQIEMLARELEETAANTNDVKKQAELADRESRLREKFNQALSKAATEENHDNITGFVIQKPRSGGESLYNDDIQFNEAISQELFVGNAGDGIVIDKSESMFEVDTSSPTQSKAGKDVSIEQRRGELQDQLAAQKKAIKKEDAFVNALIDIDEASIPLTSEIDSQGDGEEEPSPQATPELDSWPKQGSIIGYSNINGWGDGRMLDKEVGVNDVRAGQGGRGAQPEEQQWTTAGGLSLRIDVPTSGQKLTLSKVGGGPKLALNMRPQQFRDRLFDAAWLVIWAGLGLSLVFALRRPTAAAAVLRIAPLLLFIAGCVWYFLLPAAPVGFAILIVGAIWMGMRYATAT